MKVLLVGLGSISAKHIHALQTLDASVEILALRSKISNEVAGITNLFDWNDVPNDLDFILICNPSSEHYTTIWKACEFGVPLFIEKPALIDLKQTDDLFGRIYEYQVKTYVAFNFRFHPALVWLKNNLPIGEVREVQAYCGSYLPNWRPTQDYRSNYSAKAELGGGVHLDLIHELDYITWIFGQPKHSFGAISKVSDLEISSSDSAHYWLSYEKMNASILLNYFRKDAKRTLEIVMNDKTYFVNLITSTITDHNGNLEYESTVPVIETYTAQMKYFIDAIKNEKPLMNSLEESIHTLKICLSHASK